MIKFGFFTLIGILRKLCVTPALIVVDFVRRVGYYFIIVFILVNSNLISVSFSSFSLRKSIVLLRTSTFDDYIKTMNSYVNFDLYK